MPLDTAIASNAAPAQESGRASTALRHVVTGNRLRDGVPVYFTGDGRWSTAIEDARSVAAEAAESLLADAQGGSLPHPVVAPYLIEAAIEDGRLRPQSLRERIRAYGPTVRWSPG